MQGNAWTASHSYFILLILYYMTLSVSVNGRTLDVLTVWKLQLTPSWRVVDQFQRAMEGSEEEAPVEALT